MQQFVALSGMVVTTLACGSLGWIFIMLVCSRATHASKPAW